MDIQMRELYERIASMQAYEVPQVQIALVCGISESRVSQILIEDDYIAIAAGKHAESFEKNTSMNDGWDTLEQTALTRMLLHMQHDPDPEFALKVAAVANKANRRGVRHNKPISGDLGARVVVSLNQVFVAKLQTNVQINQQSGNGSSGVGGDSDSDGNGNGCNTGEPQPPPPQQMQKRNSLLMQKKDTNFLSPTEVESMFETSDQLALDAIDSVATSLQPA